MKLINVPTMFDVGCSSDGDPSADFLSLTMVDQKTFTYEHDEFLTQKHKLKMNKINKYKNALAAIHSNLLVSEVTIVPLETTEIQG